MLFRTIRDDADDIFCKLPPPVASREVHAGSAAGGGSSRPIYASSSGSATTVRDLPPVNMASFNRADNPCFHAQARVLLADGMSSRAACEVKKGDEVFGGNRVACVLRTECVQGEASLVSLPGGLLVTPWHPVRLEGKWVFPADIAAPRMLPCPAVFSFLVEKPSATGRFASEITIDGVPCATLAHGVANDAVLSHAFFGTTLVVDALKACKGWEQGLVSLSRSTSSQVLRRDEKTGLVCGLVQAQELILA